MPPAAVTALMRIRHAQSQSRPGEDLQDDAPINPAVAVGMWLCETWGTARSPEPAGDPDQRRARDDLPVRERRHDDEPRQCADEGQEERQEPERVDVQVHGPLAGAQLPSRLFT